MCFSTTASFVAAGTLSVIGVVSLNQAKRPSQFMLASIPLLFGLQQFSEGFVWLALQHSAYSRWQSESTWAFLFFAQFLWTTWVPVSYMMIETNKVRKTMLKVVSLFGVIASIMLGLRLLFYPVTVEILEHHIYYGIDSPQWMVIVSSVCYVLAIIFPPFLSSIKHMRKVGIILLVSLLVSKIFFEAYLISTWCFFAAALSAGIIIVVRKMNDRGYLTTEALRSLRST